METKQKKRPSAGQAAGEAPRAGRRSSKTAQARSTEKRTAARGAAAAPRSGQAARRSAPRPERQRKKQPPKPVPEVVYTPPKPFSGSRLVLRLATVVAVVLAITFGISIFFKVQHITVSGTGKYTAWEVREASGIQDGENLLTFGKARAKVKIMAALPYVKSVRIGIKLPDTVNIEIEEQSVVYSVRDQSNSWWLITSEGQVVDQADGATAGQYTKVEGVRLAVPAVGQQAKAAEAVTAPDPTGESTPVTVLASERLDAALSILQYLEQNGIIGQAASVNVTNLSQIELWYGEDYQVLLGDETQLGYKVQLMTQALRTFEEKNEHNSGILDVSLTVPNYEGQAVYTPFS